MTPSLRRLPIAATLVVAFATVACASTASASARGLPQAATQSTSSHIASKSDSRTPRVGDDALTFDELPLGTTVADQYISRGVRFVSNVFTTSDGANPTSPVLSGRPLFQGEISAAFVTPGTTSPTTVNGFSLDVGYIDSRSSVVVDYLDADGIVVGSQYAQSYGINHLTIAYRGIASFTVYTVSDEPAGFAIDNLRINPTVSATVSSIASMGDSYSSGEGRTDGRYDCGTDLERATYIEDTTVPLWAPFWIEGHDCDTRTLAYERPADLYSRRAVLYDERCHRNGQAYPNLVARTLRVGTSIFVACSGAVTANVGATGGLNPPKAQHPHTPVNVAGGQTQLTNVEDFRAQRLGGRDPDVITIGIGGNDAGFSDLAAHCVAVTTSDCKDGSEWADEVLSRINGEVFDKLVDTLQTLRDEFPQSTLLVFGYPTVVEPGATCGGRLLFMDANETRFLGGTVFDALNSAVSDAAAAAGAFYVDISRVTVGHDVCADDPWINGIIVSGFGAAVESLHPNLAAHAAIGRFFEDHYTDGDGKLLVANPDPSDSIRPAIGHSMHLATLRGQVDAGCGAGCLQPAVCVQACEIHVQGEGYSPGAQLQAVLHSTPVALGDVTADASGSVDTTIRIPAGTEPGLHWLTLNGTASDGDSQYGTLAVNVYETPPPPTRVPPPVVGSSNPGTAPPPPTASPQPTPLVDRTPPVVRLSGATVQRLGRTVVVTVSCPAEPCVAKIQGTVRVPRVRRAKATTYRLKAVTKRIATGKKARVTFVLSSARRSKIRRAINARKRVVVKLVVIATDAAGNATRRNRQVRLKR